MDKKKVLIASNDFEVTECAANTIDEERFHLIYSDQASQVLLTLLDTEIDLLIFDLDLSGMTGLELIPIIRKVRPNLPLIVISNDNSFETGREVAKHGVWLFLLKPIDQNKLESFLNYVQMQNKTN
ncbi:MAG: response regulator [bacterium]